MTGVQTCALPILAAFVAEQIPFDAICRVVELTIGRSGNRGFQAEPGLDDLLQADQWARKEARGMLDR